MTIQNCSVTDNMRIDRILEIAKEAFQCPNIEPAFLEDLEAFYKLAHQDGQRAMRERAAKECEDNDHLANASHLAEAIRNLEII